MSRRKLTDKEIRFYERHHQGLQHDEATCAYCSEEDTKYSFPGDDGTKNWRRVAQYIMRHRPTPKSRLMKQRKKQIGLVSPTLKEPQRPKTSSNPVKKLEMKEKFEGYHVQVTCWNCLKENELTIPFGIKVKEAVCPNCAVIGDLTVRLEK